MNRPNEEIEKSLNSLGIFTAAGAAVVPQAGAVGVSVEVPINPESFVLPEFSIRTVSRRGVKIDFGNWRIVQRAERHALVFDAIMPIPDGQAPVIPNEPGAVAMTYLDLCWNVGVEEKPDVPPALEIPLASGAIYADLGWYLPSRFVDQLVDSLGKMNDTFMDGALENAVLYGTLKW